MLQQSVSPLIRRSLKHVCLLLLDAQLRAQIMIVPSPENNVQLKSGCSANKNGSNTQFKVQGRKSQIRTRIDRID